MNELVFGPSPAPTLQWLGSDQRIAVRRTYYVGLNYPAHAREMGKQAEAAYPSFFTKPSDTLLPVALGESGQVPYPPATADLQHEIELVVVIGKAGQDIATQQAHEHIFGYALGLDLTRRDLQREGRFPVAKVFDHASPISAVVHRDHIPELDTLNIGLWVNDQPRQAGHLSELTWGVPQLIAHLSGLYRLHPGDLIFTGTPAGTSTLLPGDHLHGRLGNRLSLDVTII